MKFKIDTNFDCLHEDEMQDWGFGLRKLGFVFEKDTIEDDVWYLETEGVEIDINSIEDLVTLSIELGPLRILDNVITIER